MNTGISVHHEKRCARPTQRERLGRFLTVLADVPVDSGFVFLLRFFTAFFQLPRTRAAEPAF